MGIDRRDFLKIAGISALGLAVKPIIDSLSGAELPKKTSSKAGTLVKRKLEDSTGTQWGMVINLRKCPADCKDCIDACNRAHNVPEIDNPKKDIKWIYKVKGPHASERIFPEREYVFAGPKYNAILVLCNHCDNPPCVRVCPTHATFKREDGIVMMDYHRCIGCRYCMVACPYGSRSFNFKDPRPFIKEVNPEYPTRYEGVVEKCTFCSEIIDEQIRKGERPTPVCVEACKENALIFGNLEDPNSEIRKVLYKNHAIQREPHLGTGPNIYYIV